MFCILEKDLQCKLLLRISFCLLFRDYLKKQKSIKDEIERESITSFKKVSDETSKLRKVSLNFKIIPS